MNLPNSVSFLRILFIPLIVFLLLSPSIPYGRTIAIAVFVIVALSDYIDGYLARKLEQETTLGKFLDPLADKILVISVLLCFVELKAISSVPVMLIIARDLAVSGLRMVASSSGRIIAADTLGKWKAAALDVSAVLLMLNVPGSVPFLWACVLLSVVSGILYFTKNWGLLNG